MSPLGRGERGVDGLSHDGGRGFLGRLLLLALRGGFHRVVTLPPFPVLELHLLGRKRGVAPGTASAAAFLLHHLFLCVGHQGRLQQFKCNLLPYS